MTLPPFKFMDLPLHDANEMVFDFHVHDVHNRHNGGSGLCLNFQPQLITKLVNEVFNKSL